MKRIIYHIDIKITVCLFVLLLGTACTKVIEDNDPILTPDSPQKDRLENISVVIGAADIMETKAMHGDEYAETGEFIHSLHLFIVSENNQIEKHIIFNQEEDITAEKGNLAHYTALIDYVVPGKKTFYAFANMENAKVKGISSSMDDVLRRPDFDEGKEWTDVSSYWIEYPMRCIDIANDKFIPMSTQQKETLSIDGQHISLSLIRLVAKVKMQLANNQGTDVKLSKVTMKSFAENTPLFKTGTRNEGAAAYTKNFSSPIVVKNNENSDVLEFYVNETDGDTPFEVSLVIDDKEYTGVLSISSLERNHVLPVSLHLLKNSLVLDISATVAPVGGYPTFVNLGNGTLTNNYLLKLPEGCSFSIAGRIVSQEDEGITQISEPVTGWSWSVSEAYRSIITMESALDAQTLVAHLTAMPNQSVQLLFNVSAPQQINNASLTILTVPLQDWDTTYPTSSLGWSEKPVWYEAVSLMKRK